MLEHIAISEDAVEPEPGDPTDGTAADREPPPAHEAERRGRDQLAVGPAYADDCLVPSRSAR